VAAGIAVGESWSLGAVAETPVPLDRSASDATTPVGRNLLEALPRYVSTCSDDVDVSDEVASATPSVCVVAVFLAVVDPVLASLGSLGPEATVLTPTEVSRRSVFNAVRDG
jgi:hypothetical protein